MSKINIFVCLFSLSFAAFSGFNASAVMYNSGQRKAGEMPSKGPYCPACEAQAAFKAKLLAAQSQGKTNNKPAAKTILNTKGPASAPSKTK